MTEEITDDRFDEEGRMIRCVCGGDLRDAPDEMWGLSKRCNECAREYA